MTLGPALVQAGGGIIGGLLGDKPPRPSEMMVSHMKGIRQGAEKYGFNPLAFTGTSPTMGTAAPNYIGSAIADAASAVASAWSENSDKQARADALEVENERLRKQVVSETLRPVVPGIYGTTGKPGGVPIVITNSAADGWMKEYDPNATFVGTDVRMRGDGAYDARNPARTVIRTPLGDTTPADVSDAEDWEKRYGDPVSWAVGIGNLAMDAGASLRTATDKWGWTDPNKWVGQDTWESLKNAAKGSSLPKPTGYTEDGRPFWTQADGSVKWSYH